MKAVIVYEGVHGPTELLAHEMCEEIIRLGQDAEAHTIEKLEPQMLEDADVVFLGSPTRHGRALPRARDLANIIGELCPMNVVAAAFDTELPGSARRSAAEHLERQFRRLGLSTVDPGRFLLADASGPLKPGEIQHARAWTHGVMRHVAA